jgi:hypothetical protein
MGRGVAAHRRHPAPAHRRHQRRGPRRRASSARARRRGRLPDPLRRHRPDLRQVHDRRHPPRRDPGRSAAARATTPSSSTRPTSAASTSTSSSATSSACSRAPRSPVIVSSATLRPIGSRLLRRRPGDRGVRPHLPRRRAVPPRPARKRRPRRRLVANAVRRSPSLDPRGDILVFLPGEREIREAMGELASAPCRTPSILPLHARLPQAEQQRVFQTIRPRRIVLATNVAETSLTIPGIVYVVDAGVARLNRYDVRTGVTRLTSRPSPGQRRPAQGPLRPHARRLRPPLLRERTRPARPYTPTRRSSASASPASSCA